jgi:hypothetical protein
MESGRYDDIAKNLLMDLHAKAVLLLVLEADKGSGFSTATTDPSLQHWLPCFLRNLAAKIAGEPGINVLNPVRDTLIEWMTQHRQVCKDKNCAEPVNMIAWLAHCTGVRSDQFMQLRDEIARYEATCENCQHLRN